MYIHTSVVTREYSMLLEVLECVYTHECCDYRV